MLEAEAFIIIDVSTIMLTLTYIGTTLLGIQNRQSVSFYCEIILSYAQSVSGLRLDI